MNGLVLTCDRQDGALRVAVWQGRDLRDLYLERLDEPDLTGATVRARVDRMAPKQKAAWLDAGGGLKVYAEKADTLRSGECCLVRITAPARQDKAWGGVLVEAEAQGNAPGMVTPPPFLWQRALDDTKDEKITALTFADKQDRAVCEKWLIENRPKLLSALQPLAKESVHPELDDVIEGLSQPVVSLPGGGSIVIEQTEALVSIDVNSGETQNELAVNLLAAKEIAWQIRLRNLSGIIVIDALKMKQRPDRAKVLNALTRATAHDPAGVQVFGMTKLGLIEMTRRRRGRSITDISLFYCG